MSCNPILCHFAHLGFARMGKQGFLIGISPKSFANAPAIMIQAN